MHSSRRLLALLLPLLLLLGAAPGPTRALSDEERRTMVELHNRYRAEASPPAANMLQMVSVVRGTHLQGLKGCQAGPPTNPSHPLANAASEAHLSSQ